MAPRAVFFDLVGTLVHPRVGIGQQYAEVARRHGGDADPASLERAFAREMAATPGVEAWRGTLADAEIMERAWWRGLVERVFRSCGVVVLADPPRFDRFFDDLYRHFTTAEAWQLYPDVLPALGRARSAGIVAGLVTNYDTRVFTLLDSLSLAAHLDSVVIPATAGAQKPSPLIFGHALRAHGLSAGEAAYVGDSLEDDYRGARRAGMGAVLLDREGRHKGLPGVARAATLHEALSLLDM